MARKIQASFKSLCCTFIALYNGSKVKGLDFENCFNSSVIFEDEGLKIRTIHINNLLEAKKMAGRSRDLDDLENLSTKN